MRVTRDAPLYLSFHIGGEFASLLHDVAERPEGVFINPIIFVNLLQFVLGNLFVFSREVFFGHFQDVLEIAFAFGRMNRVVIVTFVLLAARVVKRRHLLQAFFYQTLVFKVLFRCLLAEVFLLVREVGEDLLHVFHHDLVKDRRVDACVGFAVAALLFEVGLGVTDQVACFVRDYWNLVGRLERDNAFVNHVEAVADIVFLVYDFVLDVFALLSQRNGCPHELLALLLILAKECNLFDNFPERFDHN